MDAKLVRLARNLGAKLFTNDYNLGKIAELQSVQYVNIHEVAKSFKNRFSSPENCCTSSSSARAKTKRPGSRLLERWHHGRGQPGATVSLVRKSMCRSKASTKLALA